MSEQIDAPPRPIQIRDDRGEELRFSAPPARIISLVPSDTYSLLALGAGSRVVGRTRYCVEPKGAVEEIPIVGGTKDADIARIKELAPDVVIANQEENSRPDIEALVAARIRVLISFPQRVAAGIAHLARLAILLGIGREASVGRDLVAAAYHAERAAQARRKSRLPVRVFIPIWMDPLMTANGDTFLSDMLDLVGAQNVFSDRIRRYPLSADVGTGKPLAAHRVVDRDTRYPRVTLEEITALAPELILLPDEPYAFSAADADVFRALDVPAAKNGHITFCDGKDLMWYGARSVEGIERLRAIVDQARPSEPPPSGG